MTNEATLPFCKVNKSTVSGFMNEKLIAEPFAGCTSTPVTVMNTDTTPARDRGASTRLTFKDEVGALLPPPPQAVSVPSTARTG